MIILNVGLKIDTLGDEFNTNAITWARAAMARDTLDKCGYNLSMTIAESRTERTAIITVHNPDTDIQSAVNALACALGQDCIAMYDTESGRGTLIGINADKWGEFNKDYFLMP